jgi:lysophospholipid acyltransferase (LPLAT)-like uncharacterized protein
MNKVLKQKIFLFIASVLTKPILMLYRSTLSIRIYHRSLVQTCQRRGESLLYEFWHEYMILPLLIHENQGIRVLVSQHFDGEIIARILKAFGYRTVRGSSTRGGREAYHEMKKKIQNHRHEMAFTPDGPRGPRRISKPGIIRLASETGALIIPMAIAANKFIRLNSWDKLFIMLPFSRCALVYHEPIYIPAGLDSSQIKEYSKKLDTINNLLEKEAEKCLAT